MTASPDLSYLESLHKDADGFADAITVAALLCVAYVMGRMVGHWFGWWDALSPATGHMIGQWLWFWLICKAVWATIDYVIYAVTRVGTEWLHLFLHGVTESAPAGEEPATAPTTQRETAVAYLHDFLRKRQPRQVTDDGAAPADPLPPSAA